jgi:predicted DNA-binding transcriptional regulator AlpA
MALLSKQSGISKMDQATILNEKMTAEYIGMSISWLRQARMNGNKNAPPFLKIGKSVRYRKSDLDAWLESKLQTNTLYMA